ncbi:hypothetical protein [Granulicella aggregans]|uniref:hypothetical protein n=1 Tax=Granulicella aggregans TaxID=474949 RepID=UPI0021E069DA|nr:hypothetical protein [Granulicella aggregans]
MQTLYVRYCAFFPITRTQDIAIELLLSVTTLEEQVSRYANITLVFYTLSAYKQNYLDLCAMFSFPSRVIALDEEYASELTRWEEIANEIKHKTKTDHRCIIRMFADFHILPPDQHRLLIGCDIFFLKVPQEVLAFTWNPNKQAKVLYMADMFSFGGTLYKLRHYKPPILEGLLGDFYCLAPGVHLTEEAIKGCLRMIDDWPGGAHRWDPIPRFDDAHACEQQAAAILLHPFGGQLLPAGRYSHNTILDELAVIHTHSISNITVLLADKMKARARELVAVWPE